MGGVDYCSSARLLLVTMSEEEFEQAEKPHHIQISDTFQIYILIPGLVLLAVLGKIIDNMVYISYGIKDVL